MYTDAIMLKGFLCGGCHQPIHDKYMLNAMDKYWHEHCLKCACCQCLLGQNGSKLFVKQDMLLCQNDYHRLFGKPGCCAACNIRIPSDDMVMRARENVYHLKCFSCQACQYRFCVGDKFYLSENKVLCPYDYSERQMFLQAAYSDQSLSQITKNIQELGDFEPLVEQQMLSVGNH